MPDHRITELDSGLRIATEHMSSVRSAALGFFVATGSRGETPGEAGLSHFLEHLLFRGTDRFASAEIDQLFDGMGAELNAGTDKETTTVYARMLDQHLPRAFDVMADMVWRPAFHDIDPEREVVLEEIAMYEDDPQDTVFDVLGEAVFGGHPLGRPIIGRAPVIRDTPVDEISAFHALRYVPRSVVIAAAGSVDHDQIVELAESTLGGQRAGEAAPVPDPAPEELRSTVRFHRKDTEQCHVCLGATGLQRGDERRFAMRVLDAIFGGLSSSRLFQAVREERGLAYSVYSFNGQFSDTGQIGLYLGTRPDNLRQAMQVVRDELARLRERPASRGRAGARARERQGARRARHGVDRRADEPPRRVAALRPPDPRDRRDHGAHRRRDARRPEGADRRAVGARAAVRGRHRPRRGRVPRGRGGGDPRGARSRRVIRVAVAGAAGRMGQTVCAAVEGADDMELTGRADPALDTAVADVLGDADVLVDFTQPDQALGNAREALAAGVHVVIGTSGFDQDGVREAAAASEAKAFFAPNFAIGAVLMMRFAAEASRIMDRAEIVELHHPGKLDAPSGTAARTAEMMEGDVPIHSVRLPGLVADQEVILGDVAQTLSIRHVTTDRTSFMPGVLLAIRGVAELPEPFTVGLEHLLWRS